MEDNHRYRVEYSENIAPKYPAGNHDGIEVVPSDSPFYPHPIYNAPAPPAKGGQEWPSVPNGWSGAPLSAVTVPEEHSREEKRRVLGLTVPKSNTSVASDTTSTYQPSRTSAAPASATTTAPANGPLPSDGGCPLINGQTYTPYAVDGKPIPLAQGLEGQQFRQQCYTNYVASGTSQTHDILRIFMPSLENCMMACAEYNSAYYANLGNGTGVGGGFCVAVTIVKVDAGFCYLKNGTTTNNTLGHPDIYSSAVLLTKIDLPDS
ncbi:uncharacterized protein F4812DRAFT_454198 [Daldinia caldariorum]|uniref:uncharacterized protein n=1 Tax=Daldinia caldariorum TaxID=326644 RepID=UPI002007A167|nr:uncharacterized protein F4812DRAFT_454198 [Daldinia caldariorum]KAI1472381.1 hypothetical protein F4812DRAFT_454198 [Daldinia caldariorum]